MHVYRAACRENWACMKQVVGQAVLASLAEVAAREQGPGTRAFRLKWTCARLASRNVCVSVQALPCLLVAGLAHPRTHHPLVLRVPSASTPLLALSLSSHILRCAAPALSKTIGRHPLHAVSLAHRVHPGRLLHGHL